MKSEIAKNFALNALAVGIVTAGLLEYRHIIDKRNRKPHILEMLAVGTILALITYIAFHILFDFQF